MYGTIARLQVKPGKASELMAMTRSQAPDIEGILFEYVYQMDSNPNEYMLVVGFESKEAYHKNAESPEQHERYIGFREMLDADPEWNDGEIVSSPSGVTA